MKDKLYKGWSEQKQKWEEFGSDDPAEATPSASGYERVIDLETGEEIYG